MTWVSNISPAVRQPAKRRANVYCKAKGVMGKLTCFALLFGGVQGSVIDAALAQRPVNRMTLTFDEEFKSFDWGAEGGHRWMTRFPYGGTAARTLTTNEQEYYSDSSVGVNPFNLRAGVLDITASAGLNKQGQPYNSGLITTYTSFAQLYGYFEMNAWLPDGPGLWSAFWMLPRDRSWPPELDVVEMLGRDSETLYFSTHTKIDGRDSGHTIPVKIPDVSKGFHTYGVDWQPETITWFFDDRAVASAPTPPDMHKPMFLLVNLAVGKSGSWPDAPNGNTHFPAHMLIKWIHAYKKPGF